MAGVKTGEMVRWARARIALATLTAAAGSAWAIPQPSTAAPGAVPATVTIDVNQRGLAINLDLGGFNWRTRGEIVAPLHPSVIRSFAGRLGRIAVSPGVYNFAAADAEIDAVESTGATAMMVIIERPKWANQAGSVGYEDAVAAVVRHYNVDRVAAGHRPVWFESGNEPEFPPTSHGQLPWEFTADVGAQVRAVSRVELAAGIRVVYGGPGALFADPAIAAAFVTTARQAGRLPDFVSWHAYSNAPLLGPDGPEDPSQPAETFWQVDHGNNPVASPATMGAGADVMRRAVSAALLPGDAMPALSITEWNLSSGGFDHRHDTYEGAAHAMASLIEMQGHGVSTAMFFSSVDRHCSDAARNPSGSDACGDWGTGTISGKRKPVWFAFDLWNRMAGQTVAVAGSDPAHGFWALASVDGSRLRVLLVSFSTSMPTARVVSIAGLTPSSSVGGTIRRLDPSHPDAAAEALPAGIQEIDLPANSAALVELAL